MKNNAVIRQKKVAMAGMMVLAAGMLLLQFLLYFKGDKFWGLLAGQMLWEGKKLYTGVFEVNPPMQFGYLYLAQVVSHAIGVKAGYVLVAFTAVLVALSVSLCLRLLRYHPCFADHPSRQKHVAFLLVVVQLVAVLPTYFADREHVFCVLTMPYWLRWLPSLSPLLPSWRVRCLTGVMAGIGFCIKPHMAVFFVAIQLLFWLHQRSCSILWNSENLLIYGVGVIFLGYTGCFLPAYFTQLLPMAMVAYGGFNAGDGYKGAFFLPLFSLAIGMADFRRQDASPYRRDIYYLLGLVPAGIAYVFVNNGWGYTFLPLSTVVLLTVGWIGYEFAWLQGQESLAEERRKRFTQGRVACFIALALNCFVVLTVSIFTLYSFHHVSVGAARCMETFAAQLKRAPAHSFGSISESFYFWPTLAEETGATFETRYYHFWMLPKFKQQGEAFREKNVWVLERVAKGFAEDLEHNRPGVVFVEQKAHYMLDYLNPYPSFQAVWAHYQPVQDVPAECGFDLYRRQ